MKMIIVYLMIEYKYELKIKSVFYVLSAVITVAGAVKNDQTCNRLTQVMSMKNCK